MNKCIIYSGILVLLTFGLLVGCTKEDVSNCPSGMVLSISYDAPSGDKLLSESIDNISVYIFDSQGKYVKTVTKPTKEIESAGSKMSVYVADSGFYKLITLGDSEDLDYAIHADISADNTRSLTPLVSDIEDFRVQLKHNLDHTITKELGGFFMDTVQNVEAMLSTHNTYTTDLIKNNKLIRVTIKGLSSVEPIIRSKNSLYNKSNNILDTAKEIIYKPYSIDVAKGVYLTTTLRIMETIDMPLTIESKSSGVVGSYDLVDLIQLNPKYTTQESIDREDTFDLSFVYADDTFISIKVNEWEVINVVPKP